MKKITILLIIILCVNFLKAQWIQTTLGNIAVYTLIEKDSIIFAGTGFYGVYYTTNNGNQWIQTSLNSNIIFSLYSFNNNLLSAVSHYYDYLDYNYLLPGIYRSTNNGLSWIQTLNNYSITSFTSAGNFSFASGYDGIYSSSDSGNTWFRKSLNNYWIGHLMSNGSNLYGGSDTGGLYKSTNMGLNWYQTTFTSHDVRSILIIGPNIFVGTYGQGIFRSTNNGSNWSQTNINNMTVLALISYGSNILAGTGDANSGSSVFVSTNNGNTWIQKNEGMGNQTVLSLVIKGNYIFAGTYYNVWKRPLSEILGVGKISSRIPNIFSLSQNYPNPFNSSTKIKIDIQKAYFTKLIIYDILSCEVEILVNEELKPGSYEYVLDATNYPSGIYFYKLLTQDFQETKKMILLK